MNLSSLHHSENIQISNEKKNKEKVREIPIKFFKKYTKYDVKNLKYYVIKKFKNSGSTTYRGDILNSPNNETLNRRKLSNIDDKNLINSCLNINLPKLEKQETLDINKFKMFINYLRKFYTRKNANYFYELINKLNIISYLKNVNNNITYNNSNNGYKNINTSFNNDQTKNPNNSYIKSIYKNKKINNNNINGLVNLIKKSIFPKYQMNDNVINFSILRNTNNKVNEKVLKLIRTMKIIFIKNSQIMQKLKNNLDNFNPKLSKSYSTILNTPNENVNILSKSFSSLSNNKITNLKKSKTKKVLKITYRNIVLDKNGSITKVVEKNEKRVILTEKKDSAISFIKKINKIVDKKIKSVFLNYLKSNKIMDNTFHNVDPIDSDCEPIDEKIEEFRIKLISCFLKTRSFDIDD